MSENKPRKVVPYKPGVFQEVANHIKLILRLIGDNRVSPFLKLIPIGSLLYLINPFDIPGPVDDAGVIWFGLYMFVEMCPTTVVDEHRKAITRVIPGQMSDAPDVDDEDIVEGEIVDEEPRKKQ